MPQAPRGWRATPRAVQPGSCMFVAGPSLVRCAGPYPHAPRTCLSAPSPNARRPSLPPSACATCAPGKELRTWWRRIACSHARLSVNSHLAFNPNSTYVARELRTGVRAPGYNTSSPMRCCALPCLGPSHLYSAPHHCLFSAQRLHPRRALHIVFRAGFAPQPHGGGAQAHTVSKCARQQPAHVKQQ